MRRILAKTNIFSSKAKSYILKLLSVYRNLTADYQILEGGTAYQTDAGMCGDYNSVIGMNKEVATSRFRQDVSGRLTVAKGEITLCGIIVDIDDETGLAIAIQPFRKGGRLAETV